MFYNIDILTKQGMFSGPWCAAGGGACAARGRACGAGAGARGGVIPRGGRCRREAHGSKANTKQMIDKMRVKKLWYGLCSSSSSL